jgi:hypothetical protein
MICCTEAPGGQDFLQVGGSTKERHQRWCISQQTCSSSGHERAHSQLAMLRLNDARVLAGTTKEHSGMSCKRWLQGMSSSSSPFAVVDVASQVSLGSQTLS